MRVHLPNEKGATKFELASRFAKATGKKHPDCTPPEVEKDAAYLWGLYREMSEGRKGHDTVEWKEIDAWLNVTKRKLSRFELNALRAIDRAFCMKYIEEKNGRSNPQNSDSNRRRKGR